MSKQKLEAPPHAVYYDMLDKVDTRDSRVLIEAVLSVDNVSMKKVAINAGIRVRCHRTLQATVIVWLEGTATFTAGRDAFEMRPGSVLQMTPGTLHDIEPRTDCVFLVFRIEDHAV